MQCYVTVSLAGRGEDRQTLKACWLANLAVSVGPRPLRDPVLQWDGGTLFLITSPSHFTRGLSAN